MAKHTNIPSITLEGAPLEMGQHFGETFREQILEFIASRFERMIKFTHKHAHKTIEKSTIKQLAEKLILAHKQYDADIWQEFTGIAQAANVEHSELLACMAYTDLRDYLCQQFNIPNPPDDAEECSAFITTPAFSEDGLLCGQTWDMSPEAINYLVLVKRKPLNQPETLCLTTTGCLCLIGLNSAGIAVGTTNLRATDCQPGVNYLFTLTRALREKTVNSVIAAIKKTKRLSGHNFFAASQDSGINIETSAKQYQLYDSNKNTVVFTNHYRAPNLNASITPTNQPEPMGSIYRLERMQALFQKHQTGNMQTCWDILGDKKRGEEDAAICNEQTEKHAEFATVATCLMNPAKKLMWVCKGGAKAEKQIIQLSD